jgi:hypothetical protein
MNRWTLREGICAVEWFIKCGSVTETQRAFRCELNRRDAPSPYAIRRWVQKWRAEGNVGNKPPPGRPRSVRTEQNVERFRASLVRSPRRSARKHAIALQITDRSIRRILHDDLHFHPYKMQIVQCLENDDKQGRVDFCNRLNEGNRITIILK